MALSYVLWNMISRVSMGKQHRCANLQLAVSMTRELLHPSVRSHDLFVFIFMKRMEIV